MKTGMHKDNSICATAFHLDAQCSCFHEELYREKRFDLIMKSWTLENKASFSSSDTSSIQNNDSMTVSLSSSLSKHSFRRFALFGHT